MSHRSAPEFIPIGTIFAFAGSKLPNGYLFCDGSSISRTTYWELYRVIGLLYTGVIIPTDFTLPALNLLDLYPSGTAIPDGAWTPQTITSLTTNFTLKASDIPSFATTNITPNLTFRNVQGDQMSDINQKDYPNALVDGFNYFTDATDTTTNVVCTINGTFEPEYNGGGANPVVTPVTITNPVMPSIKITYIIKAWSADTAVPPPEIPNTLPTPSYLPPSTAINPNGKVPNLSGFIYSQ